MSHTLSLKPELETDLMLKPWVGVMCDGSSCVVRICDKEGVRKEFTWKVFH